MIGKPYRSYVAIGDSLSEGLGDFTFETNRHGNGWADRLALLLAREVEDLGHEFHFANLALRGSKLSKIMGEQLQKALRLQPDLVTVMAGSNDLMSKTENLPGLQETFRSGVQQLLSAGCDVIVANTINPVHLRVFRPLREKAQLLSQIIEDVADEFEIPVLDVFSIQDFSQLRYWAKDMVHFSGHGHIVVANQAAKILGLKYQFAESIDNLSNGDSRSAFETLSWIARDVIPYCERKLRGVTSGDGMSSKHQKLDIYRPVLDSNPSELVSL